MAAQAEEQGDDGAANEESSLSGVVNRLDRAGHGGKTSVNDVLATLEDRSVGALLAAFGLISAVPVIGAIPGVSILVATLVLISIVQSARGRAGAIQLPGVLGRREIARDRYRRGVEHGRRWSARVDRLLRERMVLLAGGVPQRTFILGASAVLALAMYPLAFVPWGVTAPAFGLMAFGLALIARDGLMALIGYALCAMTAATFYWGSAYLVEIFGSR